MKLFNIFDLNGAHDLQQTAGNTLELEKSLAGQTSVTVYTYDIANQLSTAQEGSGTTWQYKYDGNGSLVEMTPGSQAGNGAKRYSYNTAGQLVRVETHDGVGYQPQAEMAYDGMGQRLSLTGYQYGQSLTTHYLLDGETTVAATANGQTTYYLSGVGDHPLQYLNGHDFVHFSSEEETLIIASQIVIFFILKFIFNVYFLLTNQLIFAILFIARSFQHTGKIKSP